MENGKKGNDNCTGSIWTDNWIDNWQCIWTGKLTNWQNWQMGWSGLDRTVCLTVRIFHEPFFLFQLGNTTNVPNVTLWHCESFSLVIINFSWTGLLFQLGNTQIFTQTLKLSFYAHNKCAECAKWQWNANNQPATGNWPPTTGNLQLAELTLTNWQTGKLTNWPTDNWQLSVSFGTFLDFSWTETLCFLFYFIFWTSWTDKLN